MTLLRLPAEILLLIVRLLGSEFFRRDTRRLTVSKWWYELAQPVLLRDLQFSPRSLSRFLRADISSLVHRHTRTVNIPFEGIQGRREILSASLECREKVISAWTTNVANDLTSLAAILQDCRNLHSLKLKPRSKWRAQTVFVQTFFSSAALIPLLSVGHLTSLDLDTISTGIDGASSRPAAHLCEDISALLPTLRRLRCRMRKICPRILSPPGDGTLSTLEEVIINLNLGDLCHQAPSQQAYRCGVFAHGIPSTWKAEMESGATDLVNRMAAPRVVRVLSRAFPGPQMECFDAITQRRRMLSPRAPWDADGDEVMDDGIRRVLRNPTST